MKLARECWGNGVRLEETPGAATPEEREVCREQLEKLAADKQRLCKEGNTLGDTAKALCEAARFAVDVDGDEPSWTQLREALERQEQAQEIREDLKDIEKAKEKVASRRHSYCFRLVTGDSWLVQILAQADSLEGLAEKITGAASSVPEL
jgi:hypothetical protein